MTHAMSSHAYILRRRTTGRYYVGHAENLVKRIFKHNNNGTPSIAIQWLPKVGPDVP
jgi:predicted GIY-YIG superfamily endonuclease